MNSVLAIPYDLTAAMLSNAVPTAGSLANLVSNRFGMVARFTNAVGSTDIRIDLGSAQPVDVIAGLWSNLRSSDTWTVLAGSTPGGSDLYNSGALGAWYSASKITSAGTKSMVVLGAPVTARYWTIRLTTVGTVNPDGYVQLSRVVLGQRISFGIDYTTLDILDDDRGSTDRSDYGEDIEDVRRISFGWRPRWRYSTYAEMLASHMRLTMRGATKPILFCPDPAASNAQDLLAFGKCRDVAKAGSQTYDIWELSFAVYSEAA